MENSNKSRPLSRRKVPALRSREGTFGQDKIKKSDPLKQRTDPPSVYRDGTSSNVARTLRNQKRCKGGEFLRCAKTPHRNFRLPACTNFGRVDRVSFGNCR